MSGGVFVDLFEEYGNDARGALDAMANVAPEVWSQFVDAAAEAQYKKRYSEWVRAHTKKVVQTTGQSPLFGPEEMKKLTVRERVVLHRNGAREEHNFLDLSGAEGAAILLAVAERDERPARTTLVRSSAMKKLAKAVLDRTKSEGRPVSVGEVLGVAA